MSLATVRARCPVAWQVGRFGRAWRAMAVCAALGLAACGAIELEPEPPRLAPVSDFGPDASELVVIVRASPAGYKAGWAVLVDGQARAWLPNARGHTRIPVAPGRHEVTASFRTRFVNIVIVPFPDWGNERHASATVRCEPRERCGLAVEATIDPRRGLILTAVEARPEQLAEWIEGLPEQPAGR